MKENLPTPLIRAPKFYAIQLKNSKHRSWKDTESFTKLNYSWQDVDFEGKGKLEDIFIAVSKAHPNYSSEIIKSVSRGIYNYPKLKQGNGIIGVNGARKVEKIGKITYKNYLPQKREIEIHISWEHNFDSREFKFDFFDSTLEIQPIGMKIMNALQLTALFDSDSAFQQWVDIEKDTNSIPHFKHFEFVNTEPLSKDDKGGKVYLFYGTNRNNTGSTNENEKYGDELSDLKYGICEVSIPRGHLQGELERPFDVWDIEILPENENRHVVIRSIIESSENEFINRISRDLERLQEQSALIFIHGYNNSFADAARRAAQIKYDVPFNGIAGFFSWPSSGRTLDYLKDIEYADASIPKFEEFVEKICMQTQVQKLHLIAHSMGNRLLTTTLNNLSNKQSFQSKLSVFNQIILAAPDIDQNVFREVILPRFQSIGNQRTLYVSDKDKALNFSERFRRGLPRLGDAGDDLFVDSKIDTIDASNVPSTGNNHSYIFETKELLTDLFLLLENGSPPIKRRLKARLKNFIPYWLFPM